MTLYSETYHRLLEEGRIEEREDGSVALFDEKGKLEKLFLNEELGDGTVHTVMNYLVGNGRLTVKRDGLRVHFEVVPLYLTFGWRGFQYEGRLWNIAIIAAIVGFLFGMWVAG